MDFATITDSVNSLIKTAAGTGGNMSSYKDIPSVDSQREIIVSHMKSDYDDKTLNMLNSKKFAESANTFKNLLNSTEGEVQQLHSHAAELETKLHSREADLKLSSSRTTILQILLITIGAVVAIYSVFGWSSYVHLVALASLLSGFGYALYLRQSSN